MARYLVKCDVTTFYEIEIEAESAGEAWQIGAETRIEEWSANNAESVMCDLQDVELVHAM